MTQTLELAGQVALVTGASRNIGRAIALSLADAGAAVALGAHRDRDNVEAVQREITARGGRAHVILADITQEDAVARLIDETVAAFGRLDILVNNAAVRHERVLENLSYADWREVLSVALDGPFLCTRAALPHLAQHGAGTVINIGGIGAYAGPSTRSHVAAAKAGLGGFTRALARELAPKGITVNLVAPGKIDTPRPAPGPGEPVADPHRYEPLVGRLGQPDDVASAVRYLAGPGARVVTGQTLHVNGGAFMP